MMYNTGYGLIGCLLYIYHIVLFSIFTSYKYRLRALFRTRKNYSQGSSIIEVAECRFKTILRLQTTSNVFARFPKGIPEAISNVDILEIARVAFGNNAMTPCVIFESFNRHGAMHQINAQTNKKELRVERFKGFRVGMRRSMLTLKLPNSLTPKLDILEEKYV